MSSLELYAPPPPPFAWLRHLTRHYPFKNGAQLVCRALGLLRFGRGGPHWAVTEADRGLPRVAVDLSILFHRKLYFFPRAYIAPRVRAEFGGYLAATSFGPGDIVLDIGANVGFYTLMAADLVGAEGQVIAFEPDGPTYQALAHSVAANRAENVTAVEAALSDHDGEATFYRSHDATAHSLVETTDHRFQATASARVTSLDRWVADNPLEVDHIRLIKIDVEGEEARTVAGMRETLRRAGLPPLWVEVRGPRSRRAPNTFAPVRDQLAALGYRAYLWRAGQIEPADESRVVGREDVLFRAD